MQAANSTAPRLSETLTLRQGRWTSRKMNRLGALALLAQCVPAMAETAQQDQVLTATATASSRSGACTSAIEKASNLCMIRSLFNIGRINCDCTKLKFPERRYGNA
jgi:putative N-acetylmannosamine-6-phosphate epimerase